MKKKLFFVALAATVLAGCSSEDHLSSNNPDVVDNELVPVELGLTRSSVNVFQTRGTGTVGDTVAATNLYQNEDLYVLMTTIGATPWDFTQVGQGENSLGPQFDGSFKSRPVEGLEPSVWGIDYTTYTGGLKKYYPTDGAFSDFFAFHVDDAAVTDGSGLPVITHEDGTDIMTVGIKIDGTQDILVGKAEKDEADLAKQVAAGIAETQRGYSAKTARKGITPVIPMKHLLTRLTFGLTPGHQTAKGLIIDSIKIVSPNEGVVTVAYDNAGTINAGDLIAWETNDDGTEKTDSFRLKTIPAGSRIDAEGNKTKLVDVTPLATIGDDEIEDDGEGNYTFNTKNVGDAFFVRPNQRQFPLRIFYSFPYTDAEGSTAYYHVADDFYVRLKSGDVLEVGKSYHVNIIVYGLSEIELKTTLEAWVDGGVIDIDTDDPSNSTEELEGGE